MYVIQLVQAVTWLVVAVVVGYVAILIARRYLD